MTDQSYPTCAACPFVRKKKICLNEDGRGPKNCPTIKEKEAFVLDDETFSSPEEKRFFIASITEAVSGVSRLQETVDFAKRMGYRRLGLVFCRQFIQEAKKISAFLQYNDFSVVSAICKVGRNQKGQLIDDLDEKEAKEILCNPFGQAEIVNRAKTEFNIVVGLCVGHDSLFLQNAGSPSTVLVVKDRKFAHNPVAGIKALDMV